MLPRSGFPGGAMLLPARIPPHLTEQAYTVSKDPYVGAQWLHANSRP